MPDKPWKRFERLVASFFDTKRTALSGGNSHVTRSDSLHPYLYVECKKRKKQALWALWEDTKEKAKKEKKIPIICLSENGKDGFIIAIHSKDFENLVELMETLAQESKEETTNG